ncbi:MAG: competence protein ComEC [Bacteroidia bacterium]|jgi:competence protein ComEC
MKVWNSFPMLRLIIPFVAGVVVWAFLLEEINITLEFIIGGLVTVLLLAIVSGLFRNFNRKPHWYGLFLWPILFALGSLLTISVSNYIFPDYLNESSCDGQQSYIAVVVNQPQVKEKSVKIIADVSDFENHTNGKVLLYFQKDSVSTDLKYGEKILIRTQLQRVEGMGNPNEFNYARYLRFNDIIFRGYVKSEDWKSVSKGSPSIKGWFLSVRSKLICLFEEAGLEDNTLSVASALVLGYRTELDKDLMSAYAGAGATHVLAVSGLHVGIVYVILNGLLKFMDRKRSMRIIKTLLLISLLFGYAALTGLSASVFRAATMFSFVAAGRAFDRNTNIFNTLAASAFCLILYEPMIIMQVGFQLSYLAVIGIVVIQPRLFELTYFNNRLADWAWSITCVSVAAQIATFPLGLLYFHQFPNLFLISNLLVIPAAGLILYLGFSLFLASIWKPALLFFGFLLDTVISGLNQVVVWIERIPYSVISGIDIATYETLMTYVMILGFLVFIVQKQRFGLYLSLSLSVIFMVFQIMEVYNQKNQNFIGVYNVKKETVVALVHGADVSIIASKEFWDNEQARLFHVQHHWWNKGISNETHIVLGDSLVNRELEWGGKRFTILDLTNATNQKMRFDVSKKFDFTVLTSADWKNCSRIQGIKAERTIVSNNFGTKMNQRIQELAIDNPTLFVAETGMLEL